MCEALIDIFICRGECPGQFMRVCEAINYDVMHFEDNLIVKIGEMEENGLNRCNVQRWLLDNDEEMKSGFFVKSILVVLICIFHGISHAQLVPPHLYR